MRLLDDRGALGDLLRYQDGAARNSGPLDFSSANPPDFESFEQVLRALRRNREQSTSITGD
jgi:hypothetical protein